MAALRRPDMQQFRQLEEEYGGEVARNAWGEFTEVHRSFCIPHIIETARTFLRDE